MLISIPDACKGRGGEWWLSAANPPQDARNRNTEMHGSMQPERHGKRESLHVKEKRHLRPGCSCFILSLLVARVFCSQPSLKATGHLHAPSCGPKDGMLVSTGRIPHSTPTHVCKASSFQHRSWSTADHRQQTTVSILTSSPLTPVVHPISGRGPAVQHSHVMASGA